MMRTYCCYCGEEQADKISCCSENHFVPFDDLYDDMKEMILEELGDGECS